MFFILRREFLKRFYDRLKFVGITNMNVYLIWFYTTVLNLTMQNKCVNALQYYNKCKLDRSEGKANQILDKSFYVKMQKCGKIIFTSNIF